MKLTDETTRAFWPGREVTSPAVAITLTNTFTRCVTCKAEFPTVIRRMAPDGFDFRNQARCTTCRNRAGAK